MGQRKYITGSCGDRPEANYDETNEKLSTYSGHGYCSGVTGANYSKLIVLGAMFALPSKMIQV